MSKNFRALNNVKSRKRLKLCSSPSYFQLEQLHSAAHIHFLFITPKSIFTHNLDDRTSNEEFKQKPYNRLAELGKLALMLGVIVAILFQTIFQAAAARPVAVTSIVNTNAADPINDNAETGALPYQQCVPFARKMSGIKLFGDALTWWEQAAGHYARGHKPQVGAVMSFQPYRTMALGHVAMISKIIDERTVLLRHANWSFIAGRRGHVELDVRAVDVSRQNDWSEVRVWYVPLGDLGTTRWPINGFIYNRKPRPDVAAFPNLRSTPSSKYHIAQRASWKRPINADFLADLGPERGAKPPIIIQPSAHSLTNELTPRHYFPIPAPAVPANTRSASGSDPIGRIIESRMSRNRF